VGMVATATGALGVVAPATLVAEVVRLGHHADALVGPLTVFQLTLRSKLTRACFLPPVPSPNSYLGAGDGPGRRYELEKGSHCTCVGSPTGTAVTRWRVMRARMCLWVCVHVCVCLSVNDLFFRQSRMACSVYQSRSPCRSHD